MSRIKVNKTKNFTVISNTHLREKNMSLKAKGLLTLMLSLPDNWNYSIAGLSSICLESEKAIKSGLDELKQFGYLRVNKIMPNKENGIKTIQYEYEVFEIPLKSNKTEKNQDPHYVGVDEVGLHNADNKITKVQSTKGRNIEKEKRESNIEVTDDSKKKNIPPLANALRQEIKMLIGSRNITVEQILRYNEPIDRIKEVFKHCNLYGEDDRSLCAYLKYGWDLVPPKPKPIEPTKPASAYKYLW